MFPHRKVGLAVAAAAALAVVAPASASADTEVVKVRDACDPASFNAALNADICVRDDSRGSTVTFEEFFDEFPSGHDAWRFSSGRTVDVGDRVVARFDRGGEFHTFSEVAEFGPGCVPPLNQALGFPPGAMAPECGTSNPEEWRPAFEELVGPDRPFRERSVSGLDAGRHRFACLIHPWMQTTITVRED